jgi:hypothetical protein
VTKILIFEKSKKGKVVILGKSELFFETFIRYFMRLHQLELGLPKVVGVFDKMQKLFLEL